MSTLYDEIPYPTGATRVSHPDNLAKVATLFGMKPAPVARCRVLELACGDAGNLIPMAFHLPESRFVGIDLAAKPVDVGREFASFLGLKNLTLEARDVMTVTPEFGEFDYIIVHGLYAWVPPPVQEKVLQVCHDNLAPEGVAFISYNAYPGAHLKMMVRDMLFHFIRPVDSSPRTEELATTMLRHAMLKRADAGTWSQSVGKISELLTSRPFNALRHDELGEHYSPLYFHEFARRADRHGLQFLGEAEPTDLNAEWLTPEELTMLGRFDGDPVLVREQYMDFLKGRQFRQTLLCRKERPILRQIPDETILGLLVTSPLRPVSQTPDLDSTKTESFKNREGRGFAIGVPPAKRMLMRLAEQWPFPVRVAELVSADAPAPVVANFIINLQFSGLVDLRTHWVPYVGVPGERPKASPLILKQMSQQKLLTSLEHINLEFDEKARELVRRLDGTRTLADLVAELRTVEPDATAEGVASALKSLGELAVLVG